MKRSRSAWISFVLTRLVGVAVDAAVIGGAYVFAFLLRLDFQEPSWGWRKVALSFVHVLFIYLLSLVACGCYRRAWRRCRKAAGERGADIGRQDQSQCHGH